MENPVPEQYEKLTTERRYKLPKSDLIILKDMMGKLISILDETAIGLKKNAIALENLNRTIDQLTMAIKKGSESESVGISLQLTEAITSLMEYHINPRFYNNINVMQLKGGSPMARKEPSRVNHIKEINIREEDSII